MLVAHVCDSNHTILKSARAKSRIASSSVAPSSLVGVVRASAAPSAPGGTRGQVSARLVVAALQVRIERVPTLFFFFSLSELIHVHVAMTFACGYRPAALLVASQGTCRFAMIAKRGWGVGAWPIACTVQCFDCLRCTRDTHVTSYLPLDRKRHKKDSSAGKAQEGAADAGREATEGGHKEYDGC